MPLGHDHYLKGHNDVEHWRILFCLAAAVFNLFSQHKETDTDLLPFLLSVNHLSLFQKTIIIINHISFQVYTIGNAVFVMFGTSKEQKWNRRQGSQYQ